VHRCANYETVRHTSSLLVYGANTNTHTHTHTCLVLNSFLSMSDFRTAIAKLTFLSLFDKWEFGYCSYCHLKVTDCLQSWETRRTRARVCVCVCVCVCVRALRARVGCSVACDLSQATEYWNTRGCLRSKRKLHSNFYETFCYAPIEAQRKDLCFSLLRKLVQMNWITCVMSSKTMDCRFWF